ncbi:MAG: MBL fold metallo-hydrolase RNA specificity domain-containing protein [Christensenellales bacterium]|jgi:metallo-beta-lactamase family protein
MNITFLGAAKCVTGSCTLIETEGKKILIDCGMRQGRDAKNAPVKDGFVFDAQEIDILLLTHAHIDHSGMIPLLVKKGFKGRVYCTEATARLCSIMFPDAGHIQEMEAEWENRKRIRAGKPIIPPLYTVEDAKTATKHLSPMDYGVKKTLIEGVDVRFVDAGHLLGSASIELFIRENDTQQKLVFSGDIGNKDRPIIKDPVYINDANFVFMESTYGDRLHVESLDTREQLKRTLIKAIAAGGNIVIPSFAVGRTQEILYCLSVLLEEKSIDGLDNIPVYIDSPLGIAATEIFRSSSKGYYDEEAIAYKAEGIEFFSFDTLIVAQSAEESKAINFDNRQKIIISSSGMCEAGRIKHHLKHNLWKENSTVIFVGYQAIGTLGRSILDGNKTVRIFGEEIKVKAHIERIEGFSGHADQAGLLDWIRHFPTSLEKVFVMHGEEQVSELFAKRLASLGYNVLVPDLFATFDTKTFEKTVPIAAYKETEPSVETLTLQNLIAQAQNKLENSSAQQAENMKRELLALIQKWDNEQNEAV